ncbi:hypothetical protein AB0H43_26235 [Hamadaea sp. NPDC050747]|uniref:hypothetical protein n=1 Tax=Hamadaea sp. NPDC050747 TaxID=3155789 RepID=UPI003406D7A5
MHPQTPWAAWDDNMLMPAYWNAARIINHLHRAVLAAHGFTRSGQRCERIDNGLHRRLSVHTRASRSRPQVQLVVWVGIAGLPDPVAGHRYDGLGGTPLTATGRHNYQLPVSEEPLPPDLLADVAGPVCDFLLRPHDLGDFTVWAQEVFAGDTHPGWRGRFQPVLPQGTGPLRAAALAATVLGDDRLVEFLVARVENEEPSEHRFDGFLREIRQLGANVHPRRPTRLHPTGADQPCSG